MSTVEKTYIFVRKEGGGEEHVYEEDGWSSSIIADELSAYTNYRVEGGAIVDGLQATAENRVSFQTLRRNNLTATFNAVRRQGLGTIDEGGWKVYYDYTSLYALSSAILYVFQNGVQVGQYQGVADYNNHWITFDIPANDWVCCGEQYQLHVVVIDIFGQSYTTSVTTITTDVFNSVSMEYESSTTSSVTFDLDYWLDYGFASGWLDVWNEGDDPDTDQPQDHYHFFEGDTQVTSDGLDEGTTYIFRVTIALDDGQGTEIYTAYQYASTAGTDWFRECTTMKNLSSSTNSITIKTSGNAPNNTIYYSTDKGVSWSSFVTNTTGTTIRFDDTIQLRSDSATYCGNSPLAANSTSIIASDDFELCGNLASLMSSNNFAEVTVLTAKMVKLFSDNPYLKSVKNLVFPDQIGEFALTSIFGRCTSLTAGPNVSNVTFVGAVGMSDMFGNCSSLSVAYAPSISEWTTGNVGGNMFKWLYNVAPTGTLYADARTAELIPRDSESGLPSGWTLVRIG